MVYSLKELPRYLFCLAQIHVVLPYFACTSNVCPSYRVQNVCILLQTTATLLPTQWISDRQFNPRKLQCNIFKTHFFKYFRPIIMECVRVNEIPEQCSRPYMGCVQQTSIELHNRNLHLIWRHSNITFLVYTGTYSRKNLLNWGVFYFIFQEI